MGHKKMFPLKKIIESYKTVTGIKGKEIYIFYIGIEKKCPLLPPSRLNHIE